MDDSPNKNPVQALQDSLVRLKELAPSPEAQQALQLADQLAAQADAQIQAVKQEAINARQDKAKFVSIVTHELRLPLTSIRGYTDLLRQGIVGPINEQQTNFLSVIRNNAERMSALIADLSDLSHAETGRIQLNPKSTTISACAHEVITELQAKFDEKGQTIHLIIPEDLPAIQVDTSRFNQILSGMLNNANRYTPVGGRVIVAARHEEGTIRLEVKDNGVGISEADQAKLFTPFFFRSDNEAIREHPGWGLNLHVASLLIAIMGGRIGVQSKLGEGSAFWFTVPLISPKA